jgi:hypothetical protein
MASFPAIMPSAHRKTITKNKAMITKFQATTPGRRAPRTATDAQPLNANASKETRDDSGSFWKAVSTLAADQKNQAISAQAIA